MIDFEAFDAAPVCHGSEWRISDEQKLSLIVGILLLGNRLHAENVIATNGSIPASSQALIEEIVTFLSPQTTTQRYHRDGLIFQMISWVAAIINAAPRTLLRAPHVRPADKGLDGFMLDAPIQPGMPWHATVCEDKATENPRSTIRDKVWPEFREFETRRRDGEITAEVCALITNVSHEERQVIIQEVADSPLHYRVSVTVSESGTYSPLFGGYDDAVVGEDCSRRRGETLLVHPEVRAWMDGFCGLVVQQLRRSLLTEPQSDAI